MEKNLFDKILENFKKEWATSVAHDGERVNTLKITEYTRNLPSLLSCLNFIIFAQVNINI